jgi:hypothetical protein
MLAGEENAGEKVLLHRVHKASRMGGVDNHYKSNVLSQLGC